jgi:glycosyltransferase involved in cell wall biosynthesis
MRILFVAEALDRVETALLRGLAQASLEIHLLLGDTAGHAPEPDPHLQVTRSPLRSRYDWRAIRAIRACLSQSPVDVIHCLRNNRPLTNTLAAMPGRRPALIAYRGTMGHLSRFDPGSWLSYLNPRIDRIVCVSNAVKDYLRTVGIPERKAVTIYKGHDPAWYEGFPPADLAPFGIPAEAFVVCCVANMRKDKGIDALIRSLEHIPTGRPVHLLLVGAADDGSMRQAIRDPQLRSLVHFTGYRTDAPALVAASHAFVMPSIRREGLPRAVIEAMCLRVPPIVTRIGGMPELVEDGTSGIVIPPSDPAALADALTGLRSDPELCRRIGAGARRRIEGPFSIQRTIESTRRLYEEVIAG